MIYCIARSTLLSTHALVFAPLAGVRLNSGQAMESNYTVRKVYSDLLNNLNAICFAPHCVPFGNEVLTPK